MRLSQFIRMIENANIGESDPELSLVGWVWDDDSHSAVESWEVNDITIDDNTITFHYDILEDPLTP